MSDDPQRVTDSRERTMSGWFDRDIDKFFDGLPISNFVGALCNFHASNISGLGNAQNRTGPSGILHCKDVSVHPT